MPGSEILRYEILRACTGSVMCHQKNGFNVCESLPLFELASHSISGQRDQIIAEGKILSDVSIPSNSFLLEVLHLMVFTSHNPVQAPLHNQQDVDEQHKPAELNFLLKANSGIAFSIHLTASDSA